jgi:hypothetical protein
MAVCPKLCQKRALSSSPPKKDLSLPVRPEAVRGEGRARGSLHTLEAPLAGPSAGCWGARVMSR